MLSVVDNRSFQPQSNTTPLAAKKIWTIRTWATGGIRYDANGNLVSQVDAKSQTISFSYDAINRTVTKTYSTSDPTVTYGYDEGSIQNGIGRLSKIENSNASTTYKAYDVMGRAKEVVRSIAGAPKSSYTTSYAYDLDGKLASIVYPDAYQVNYAYHPGSGLLDTVIGISDFTEYADIEDYQPTGKIGYIYHGNGTATAYTYDSESTRILSIITQDPGLTYIQNKSYKYSAAGDILKIIDAAGSGSVSYSYTYDKLHRLLSENNTGGADNFQHAFLTKLYDENAPFHAPKKILSGGIEYTLAYDLNGNMTTGFDFGDPGNVAKRTIAYNADNMPTKVVYAKTGGSATVDLYYDGESKRAKKAIQGGSTTFYIDEHFEVVGGVETKYVFAGNLRIAIATSAGKHFFHKDHLGSSSVITDGLSGSPVNSTTYLPFGLVRKQTGSNSSNYKFTDQEIDVEIGLYNYDARQYDPAIGMFISADSVIPGSGFDQQMLNRYSYVRNNPQLYVDPSGHSFGTWEPGGEIDFGQNDVGFTESAWNNHDDGWGRQYNNDDSYSWQPEWQLKKSVFGAITTIHVYENQLPNRTKIIDQIGLYRKIEYGEPHPAGDPILQWEEVRSKGKLTAMINWWTATFIKRKLRVRVPIPPILFRYQEHHKVYQRYYLYVDFFEAEYDDCRNELKHRTHIGKGQMDRTIDTLYDEWNEVKSIGDME